MSVRPRKFTARAGVGARYGRRHVPGEMNKTEGRFADTLQARKLIGEIIEWHFESMTFKLAADLRYTPDFVIFESDGTLTLVDVKGSGPIDPKSLVKIKAAAERWYWFDWVMAIERLKKDGGGFEVRRM